MTAVGWHHRWVCWPAGPGPFPLYHTPAYSKMPSHKITTGSNPPTPRITQEMPPHHPRGFVQANFPMMDTQIWVLHLCRPHIVYTDAP